ncbi:TolB domain-containing protein [Bacillus sp. DNRA2]|uniref:TolB family protein n=1 Tax=Bacillus sp. DNRA2 TaxID=2723053 RepID=UPI00145D0998|nr:TolB domain-containing protein [Bacillus sp. DNRA2]NMD70901.1 TolB domain-containing protein [Bacillus sp. DNRA2]
MKKYISVLGILIICISNVSVGHAATPSLLIAFEKEGFLWIEMNGKQEKITTERAEFSYPPQWSYDGQWLLYQKLSTETPNPNMEKQNELWVYNLKKKQHKKIFYNGENPKWSPTQNIVAFTQRGVLNISDLENFHNIALGVDDYSWFPDGKSFIASSSATLRPDGWTNPVLYKIAVPEKLTNTNLMSGQRIFVIPKELTKDNVKVMSINVGSFEFSPDQKWISFIVSPTASLSMDSNMLCVLSSDGKQFDVIDEVILQLDNPQWAQTKNLLGYIAGGGRIVFGFKNKDLKITELPVFITKGFTPPNFAEMEFTWVGDDEVVVSRVKEADWSNDPRKRPKASLYTINIKSGKQSRITQPNPNYEDVQPQYVTATNQITWMRKKNTAIKGDLWIANPDGKKSKRWLNQIGHYAIFPH